MSKKTYLFTSECVSSGHPDKVADQISDAILDEFLRQDPNSKVACETMCTTGLVVVAGEVKSEAYVDIQSVARNTINKIGYTKSEYMFDGNSCGVLSAIHEQSPDINRGVERENPDEQGAGDQGMVFGYATDESEYYMPLTMFLARELVNEISYQREIVKQDNPDRNTLQNIIGDTSVDDMNYLRPDAKTQVTIEYDEETNKPLRVHTIVVSVQHDEFDTDEKMLERIRKDVKENIINVVFDTWDMNHLLDENTIIHVNPTGKFVIGGPHGDTGLTGRKIIVDTYGGRGAHGGGAFSGKDPSKVDRSGAYMARYIAKNMVAAGVAKEMLVQISYAIGVAKPVNVFVNTNGTTRDGITDADVVEAINKLFDLRPAKIIETLGLKNPIYGLTANFCHFGTDPFYSEGIKFFPWEDTDRKKDIKAYFNI